MESEKIGKLIKEARIKKGYTQKEIADLLGLTDKAVSKWECGRSFPDITLIESISRELDISVNLLVGVADTSKEEAIMIQKLDKKIKIRIILSSVIFILFFLRILMRIVFGYVASWKLEDYVKITINVIFLIIGGASLISSIILIIKRRTYENNNKS